MPTELRNDIVYNKDIIFLDSDNATWIDNEYMKFTVDIIQPIKNVVCIKIIRCSIQLNRYPNEINPETNTVTVLQSKSMPKINGVAISDDEPVYIYLNNYDRVTSLIVKQIDETVYKKYPNNVYDVENPSILIHRAGDYELDGNGNKIPNGTTPIKRSNILNCFEIMNINVTNTYQYTHNPDINIMPDIMYTKEYEQSAFNINDTSMHILKPVEPNLKRFDVEIRDKDNKPIKKYIDLLSDSDEYARGGVKSFKMMLCVYSLQQNF